MDSGNSLSFLSMAIYISVMCSTMRTAITSPVNWESFGIIDLPFYDVLTLLLSFLRASGPSPEQWSPALCKQIPMLLKRYAGALQLTTSALDTLLPLTLLNRFYLHWVEKTTPAAAAMYSELDHYFEHTSFWNDVFLRE